MKNLRFGTLVGIILLAVGMRLVPHPVNFSPVGAVALFSGAYLSRRWMALAVPLLILLLSDLYLGFHSTVAFVYGGFALSVLVGCALQNKISVKSILAGSVGSSLIFFVVSNFGVWMMQDLYPKNAGGLMACFVAALPFFQNSLVSTVIYSAALFGLFELASRRFKVLQTSHAIP